MLKKIENEGVISAELFRDQFIFPDLIDKTKLKPEWKKPPPLIKRRKSIDILQRDYDFDIEGGNKPLDGHPDLSEESEDIEQYLAETEAESYKSEADNYVLTTTNCNENEEE